MIVLDPSKDLEDYSVTELRQYVGDMNPLWDFGYKYNIKSSKASKEELIAFLRALERIE